MHPFASDFGGKLTHDMIDFLERNVLNEVCIFHPEDALTAAVCHQLVPQVLWPIGPLIRPGTVPGEPAPGVPQAQ